MATEVYRIEIPIIVDDQTEAPMQQTGQRVSRFVQRARRDIEATRKHLERIGRLRIEPIMRVRDKLTAGVLKADKLLRTLDAAQAAPVLAAQDRISAVVLRVNQVLEALEHNRVDILADLKGPLVEEINQARTALIGLSKVEAAPVAELRGKLYGQLTRAMAVARQLDRVKAEPEATLRDRVTARARAVMTTLRGLTARAWTVTLGVRDWATGLLGRIGGALSGPLALLGAGAGAYGLGKITVGAAAQFERYSISMEHWLKGNRTAALELVKWLEHFADVTPFTLEDLFPGLTRALSITRGAIGPAKELLRLAGEMAALTPSKTVMDAMEALADAQVMEFERMKEFGMKLTQEQFRAMGGWTGFLKKVEATFGGGMQRLSRTSEGLLSTILDRIQTLFRSVGVGILEQVKPRLEKIVEWFDRNQDTVERWKDTLTRFGREAFGGILDWAERVLGKIGEIIKSPEWERADWAGKMTLIIGEVERQVIPKMTQVGIELGKGLGKGIVSGLWDAIKEDKLTAAIIGAWVGLKMPGPTWLKAGVAATIAATPWVIDIHEALTGGGQPQIPTGYQFRSEAERQEYLIWEANRWAAPSSVSSVPYWEKWRIPGRAAGGIYSRPHLAMVAEAGPEAIIPLSARMRSRAVDLWAETGRRLGISPYVERPVAVAAPSPAVAPAREAPYPPVNVTNHINVTVNGAKYDNPDRLADDIALRIAKSVELVSSNMPRRARLAY